jgi:hypothetical protein
VRFRGKGGLQYDEVKFVGLGTATTKFIRLGERKGYQVSVTWDIVGEGARGKYQSHAWSRQVFIESKSNMEEKFEYRNRITHLDTHRVFNTLGWIYIKLNSQGEVIDFAIKE